MPDTEEVYYDDAKFYRNTENLQKVIRLVESAINELGGIGHLDFYEYARKPESSCDATTMYFKKSINALEKETVEEILKNVLVRLKIFHCEWAHILSLLKSLEYKDDDKIRDIVSDLIGENKNEHDRE